MFFTENNAASLVTAVKALEKMSLSVYDIMNNSQGMIPLPGTLQAGHEVKMLYEMSNY